MIYSEVLLSKTQSRRTATAIPNKLPNVNPLEITFVINIFLSVFKTGYGQSGYFLKSGSGFKMFIQS